MSVLAYPRIHFKGKCLINPSTSNNDDVVVNIDPVNVTLGPQLAAMTDDQASDWLTTGLVAKNVNNGKLFTCLRCGWNYYGDFSTTFDSALVTAVVGTDAIPRTNDPVVGSPVQLLGNEGSSAVICDVDSTGVWMPQLFVGGFSLGNPGAGLSAANDSRSFAGWMTYRNASVSQDEQGFAGYAATWQCGFPASSMTFDLTSGSPILSSLRDAANANIGVLVQFCVYQAQPLATDLEMIDRFQRKAGTRNPVECYMVGTVGVLEKGELWTVPNGRILQAAPAAQSPLPSSLNQAIGPAAARVQVAVPIVSLDLITTFPEASFDRPPGAKADVGLVRLGMIPASGGPPVSIGDPLDYSQTSYEATAGVVDVHYNPADVSRNDLDNGTLVLLSANWPAQPIVTELGTTITVETDDRGTYLDPGGSAEIGLLVRDRNRPPATDVTVFLAEYQYVITPQVDQTRAYSLLTRVAGSATLQSRLQFPSSVVFPAGRSDPLPVTVTALAPGSVAIVLTPEGQPLPADPFFPDPTSSYAGVRILPVDDYSAVPAATRLSWNFIYKTIFRFYYLLFPAMSQIIPLNDEAAMKQAARRLVELSDPSLRSSTRYMPPTRDLSAGKRALLVEWVNSLPPQP